MAHYVKKHVRKTQSERREEILEATLRLLGDYGPEGTTMARIAEAVDLTPGAIYRHFESRATLLAEANAVANERALSWIETSTDPDPLQRLKDIGDAHGEWAKEHFNTVVRPFFLELASVPDPTITARLNVESFKSYRAVVDIAEEGKRQGVIRDDVQAEDVAWALHMFAWAEDIALMSGAEAAIEDGTLSRNLARMLDSFRAEGPAKP